MASVLMIFLLMKINQFDIKTLIKDRFGLVILRSLKFLKPFLNMIDLGKTFYHEWTVFWNSPYLYFCDVDACYHVGIQSENCWRTRKEFPRLFWE